MRAGVARTVVFRADVPALYGLKGAAPFPPFGLRVSFGFRISAFGFSTTHEHLGTIHSPSGRHIAAGTRVVPERSCGLSLHAGRGDSTGGLSGDYGLRIASRRRP